jgi:alpha-L-rhamnosidase
MGYSDVAHRLLLEDSFPSWGYSIRQGATTIWERRDGWTEHAGFQTPMMNSFNHYSLGSVGQWLYEHVAGIARGGDSGERVRHRRMPDGQTVEVGSGTHTSTAGLTAVVT